MAMQGIRTGSSSSSSGYYMGEKDPYQTLRTQAQETIKAATLDPYSTPLYQAYVPQATMDINAGFAARGLADSGLAEQQLQESKQNFAAQIYQNLFANRLNAINTAAGIPYLRDFSATSSFGGAGRAGGGGGGGGVGTGVTLDFSPAQADRYYRLAEQQQQQQATQNMLNRRDANMAYYSQPSAPSAANIGPTQTQIISPAGGTSTYYGGGAPMTESMNDFY